MGGKHWLSLVVAPMSVMLMVWAALTVQVPQTHTAVTAGLLAPPAITRTPQLVKNRYVILPPIGLARPVNTQSPMHVNQVKENSKEHAATTDQKPIKQETPLVNYWNHEPPLRSGGKVVVLTFDDGPSPWTLSLIQTLNQYHVPAIFFWNTYHIHYANSQVVHALKTSVTIDVGDHTINHPNLLHLNRAAQYREIAGDAAAITSLLGKPVQFFRPPYGNYNATTVAILHQTQLTPVLWNVDSLDWKYGSNEQAILHTIQSEVRPGSIILMHDHQDTIRFLPDIIQMLQHDGYQFTTFQGA